MNTSSESLKKVPSLGKSPFPGPTEKKKKDPEDIKKKKKKLLLTLPWILMKCLVRQLCQIFISELYFWNWLSLYGIVIIFIAFDCFHCLNVHILSFAVPGILYSCFVILISLFKHSWLIVPYWILGSQEYVVYPIWGPAWTTDINLLKPADLGNVLLVYLLGEMKLVWN